MYQAKILIEIIADHHNTPFHVAQMIKCSLNYPAIKNVEVKALSSNFVLHGEPAKEFREFDTEETSCYPKKNKQCILSTFALSTADPRCKN